MDKSPSAERLQQAIAGQRDGRVRKLGTEESADDERADPGH